MTSEAITGLYGKTLGRSYDSLGRQSGFGVGGDNYAATIGYDAVGRGNAMSWNHGSFGTSYIANSDLPGVLSMPGSSTANFSYEGSRNLLLNVDNKDASATTVSKYEYANDQVGRRTSMAKSGTAFSMSESVAYGYNNRSELTSANSNTDPAYVYGYTFDSIGNRITASERGASTSYTTNILNRYTAVNTATPTYNDDGDMLTNGSGWTYTWDGENRLKTAVNGTKTLQFTYDYMSRRVERKVYNGESLTEDRKYVYLDYKHIETLDAANSNALLQKFLWNGDRLLAVYDVANAAAYSYLIDGNKNVGQLVDSTGSIVAKYEYSPFGQLTKCEGSYALSNPYRFSSEQWDDDLGLVYYNYRYYSSDLGRWLSKDPIEELGGKNLNAFTGNNPINLSDVLGLDAGSVFLGGASGLGGAYRMADAHNTRTTDNAASSGSGVATTAPPQSPAKPTPPPRHKKPDSPGKKKPAKPDSAGADSGFFDSLGKQLYSMTHPFSNDAYENSALGQAEAQGNATYNAVAGSLFVASVATVATLPALYVAQRAMGAEEVASTAAEANRISDTIKMLEHANMEDRMQLENGLNQAANALDRGIAPNPHGLGKEIYKELPATIKSREREIEQLHERMRNL